MTKDGEQYRYYEMGVVLLVTQLSREEIDKESGKWHEYKLRVDGHITSGRIIYPESLPAIGSTMTVGYADGYSHYAGWRLDEVWHG